MNTLEAKQIMAEELVAYRAKPYGELVRLVDSSTSCEKAGSSGAQYQIEVQVLWDDHSDGNIRIIGSIDDGGWRAFVPLTSSFIKDPTGKFVGE